MFCCVTAAVEHTSAVSSTSFAQSLSTDSVGNTMALTLDFSYILIIVELVVLFLVSLVNIILRWSRQPKRLFILSLYL